MRKLKSEFIFADVVQVYGQHGYMLGSTDTSKLKGPKFDPKHMLLLLCGLGMLSLCLQGFLLDYPVSFHFTKTCW